MLPWVMLAGRHGAAQRGGRRDPGHRTWGVNSTSSSPFRYCRSNSAFSPTYDEIMRLICAFGRAMNHTQVSQRTKNGWRPGREGPLPGDS